MLHTQHKGQEVNISEPCNPLVPKQQHKLSNIYACEGEGGSLDECTAPLRCPRLAPRQVPGEKEHVG